METEQKIELLSRHLTPQRLEKIMRVSADRTRYVTVVLENIFYTQNFSAVTRTCECLGIQDLYQIGTATQGRLNSDVAKGASYWVDIHRQTDRPAAQAAAALKAAGYRIVAAMPAAGAKPFTELDLSAGKIAVAMGNETDGTGEEIKDLADEFITIPMYGFTESYNVSVCAALLLYSVVQRLRRTDIDWHLSEDEQYEVLFQWYKRSTKASTEILDRFNQESE